MSRNFRILFAMLLTSVSCIHQNTEYDQALKFLVTNMKGKISLDSTSVKENTLFFKTISEYLQKPDFFPVTGLYEVADSLENLVGKPEITPSYSKDNMTISSEFLSRHIHEVLTTWESSPWKSEIPFGILLRYVLPYKVGTERWDGVRNHLRHKYADSVDVWYSLSISDAADRIISAVSSEFYSDGQFFREHPYMFSTSFENTVKTSFGECDDMNAMIVAALRSFGIPSTINTIPYWGNSNASHFWTEVIGSPPRPLYNNTQQDYHSITDELINDSFWFKGGTLTDTTGIPSEILLRKNRTVPKIYRKNYEIGRKSLAMISHEPIPPFFCDPGLQDVTASHIVTSTVNVHVPFRMWHHRYAYLCCYDPSNFSWTPVAWAKIRAGSAKFKDMGVNVLYMSAIYEESGICTFGDPFILCEDGHARQLSGKDPHTDSITVFSKVPLRTNYAYYAKLMKGDRILAACKGDLSDTVLVHLIKTIPYYSQEMTLPQPIRARYVILQTGSLDPKFVAEMQCWGTDRRGIHQRWTGTPIGNHCFSKYPLSNAFDGDPLTYSFLDKHTSDVDWIGLDLRCERTIDKIIFCPRNDDNAIVHGDEYEIFVWHHGDWESLGYQTGGADCRLHFTNLPQDGLFRVHDHTRGKENRPFTISDGKQVWW